MASRQTEPYLSTYLHARGAQLGLPIGGNFELTPRCNFNCPMCYVHLSQEDAQAAGKELSAQQWIDLARQARDEGMVFALLTGGEPFVRKDFFEIYDAMKEMGLMVSINSNGSMLSGEIRRRLLENPPFRVNISLYGGSRETYEKMCGRDSFDTVVENIRALKEAGVDVRLNLSITPYNRQDVAAIYEIAQKLNVHVKASAYMYPSIRVNGQYGAGNRLTPEDAAQCSVDWDLMRFTTEEFVQRAQSMQKMCNVDCNECGADLDEGVSCRAGHTSFWLTWQGHMLPCGMMPGPTVYPIEEGFKQAWQRLQEETKKIPNSAQCSSCPQKDICSACAAVRVTETGTFDGTPEYMCRLTAETLARTQRAWQERSKTEDAN